MMIPVFPIAYFGSVHYYKELCKNKKVLLEVHEHYQKQTLRNRTTILTANGLLPLTVPVARPNGSKTETKDILISYDKKWQQDHWRAIKSAYESSPYFDYYGLEVKEFIFSNTKNLVELNVKITNQIIEWLDLGIELQLTEAFTPTLPNDQRISLSDKKIVFPDIKSPYIQVFPSKNSYNESISILDVLFCEGPLARNLIVTN